MPVDINSECLGMMERLMLAQAQVGGFGGAVEGRVVGGTLGGHNGGLGMMERLMLAQAQVGTGGRDKGGRRARG